MATVPAGQSVDQGSYIASEHTAGRCDQRQVKNVLSKCHSVIIEDLQMLGWPLSSEGKCLKRQGTSGLASEIPE